MGHSMAALEMMLAFVGALTLLIAGLRGIYLATTSPYGMFLWQESRWPLTPGETVFYALAGSFSSALVLVSMWWMVGQFASWFTAL